MWLSTKSASTKFSELLWAKLIRDSVFWVIRMIAGYFQVQWKIKCSSSQRKDKDKEVTSPFLTSIIRGRNPNPVEPAIRK